jgi:hypothetical protein
MLWSKGVLLYTWLEMKSSGTLSFSQKARRASMYGPSPAPTAVTGPPTRSRGLTRFSAREASAKRRKYSACVPDQKLMFGSFHTCVEAKRTVN